MAELRAAVASRELLVRNPSFEHQERATLEALFGNARVDADLRAATGFAIEDAIALEEAFNALPAGALSAMVDDGRQALQWGRRSLQERRRAPTPLTDTDGFLGLLASLPRKQAESRLRNIATAWSWIYVGDRLQVTAEDLAERSMCDLAAVQAFLDFFAIGFGQPRTGPANGTNEIRERPLMHDGEGRYLWISVADLFFALRPRLTEALLEHANSTGDSRVWERFNAGRRRYLERRSVDLLQQALHPEAAYTNAKFALDGKEWEMDGLLMLDQIAIVVEAKAGTLSAASRRGAPASLRDDLKDLVTKATDQLERAQRALIETDVLKLRMKRREAELDTSRVRRVFLVAATLENLSFVAPTIWDLVHSEILPMGSEPPLLINLHDLEIICDVVDLPALLIHYFTRRGQLNRLELVRAGDELDLFVHFLRHGLYFDEVSQEADAPDVVFLQSLTDELDAYYLWQQGVRRKPARKPTQKMHKEFRRLLDQLDAVRPGGFIEASVLLLDFGSEGRKALGQSIAQQRRRAERDGEFHDVTLGADGPPKRGITAMIAPAKHRDQLANRLRIYSIAKKHQTGSDVWLGFGIVAGAPEAFQAYVLRQDPWREDDAEAAALVSELGLQDVFPRSLKEAKSVAQARRQQGRPGQATRPRS